MARLAVAAGLRRDERVVVAEVAHRPDGAGEPPDPLHHDAAELRLIISIALAPGLDRVTLRRAAVERCIEEIEPLAARAVARVAGLADRGPEPVVGAAERDERRVALGEE